MTGTTGDLRNAPPSAAEALEDFALKDDYALNPEFVDMVACDPFPEEVSVRRHFDEAVIFKRHVGDFGTGVVLVSENQRLTASGRRLHAR